jgi:hypothetical protein
MDDRYPATDDHQSVHLDYPYPDVPQDLNRWHQSCAYCTCLLLWSVGPGWIGPTLEVVALDR